MNSGLPWLGWRGWYDANMRVDISLLIFGLGAEIVFLVLGLILMTIPMPISIVGLIVGVLLMTGGVLGIVGPRARTWRTAILRWLMRVVPNLSRMESRIGALEHDKPRWESIERDVFDLRRRFDRYRELMRGDKFEEDGKRLTALEQRLDDVVNRIAKPRDEVLSDIYVSYQRASLNALEDIDRIITLQFSIENRSKIYVVRPTGRVEGYLGFEGTWLFGTKWALPIEYWQLRPGEEQYLTVRIFISERLYEVIERHPHGSRIPVNFSQMYVEFAALTGEWQAIGYKSLGDRGDIIKR